LFEEVVTVIALVDVFLLVLLGHATDTLCRLEVRVRSILYARDLERFLDAGETSEHLEPVGGNRVKMLLQENRLGFTDRVPRCLTGTLRMALLRLRRGCGIERFLQSPRGLCHARRGFLEIQDPPDGIPGGGGQTRLSIVHGTPEK